MNMKTRSAWFVLAIILVLSFVESPILQYAIVGAAAIVLAMKA